MINARSVILKRASVAATAALTGAVVALLALTIGYRARPALDLGLDRQPPRTIGGIYPPERSGEVTFAWSGGRVTLALDGIDRAMAWACRVDVINWRPPAAGPASVEVFADGRAIASQRVAEATAAIAFPIAPRPGARGLELTLAIAPTFKPGPADPRDLGLAIDRIRCQPAAGAHPGRPWRATWRGMTSAAMFGATAGLAGLPMVAALAAGAAVGALQTLPLGMGELPYTPGALPNVGLAALLAALGLVPLFVAEIVLRRTLPVSARAAVILSVCAAFLKLLFLLHPDKPLVDALFHAHRFEWVMAGRFYFTQLSTSATPFPYAIGLYLFSAPWAWLTTDHVTLLRVVVSVSEAAAGLLLYPVIVRAWNDRAAGVMAVALFHLVPLPFTVIGNANLTNAFGQSAGLVTMAAAAAWTLAPRRFGQAAALAALAAFAFISHVGTAAVLLPTLAALAAYHYWPGGAALRPRGRALAAATLLAVVLATVTYYGHFRDVYAPALARARAQAGALAGDRGAGTSAGVDAAPAGEHAIGSGGASHEAPPLRLGLGGALNQIRAGVGWPLIVLAAAGAWRTLARRTPDRLSLALLAWTSVAGAFLGLSAFRTVDPRYVQDTWEFIGRVLLATSPAIAILAGAGASWAWRAHLALRAGVIALVGLAAIPAARAVAAWFH